MFAARPLRWALVLSACLHLLLLLAGRGFWSSWIEASEGDEVVLSAKLLPPPAPPAKPVSQPPRPQPSPAASAPTPSIPSSTAAPLLPEASSTAVPATAGPGADARGAGVPARALPASGRLHFVVTKGEQAFVVGQAVHAWTVEGDRYELNSTIETTGLIALFTNVRLGQSSSGQIVEGGLRPLSFRDNRKDGSYRADFDWAQQRLQLGNGSSLPLAEGAQDVLSMFYQFALYPLDMPELTLMVTTGRKFERYVFKVEADVPLTLRGHTADSADGQTEERTLATYHLSYRGRDAEGVDVWLARDLDRLPVKIRYVDRKGGLTELQADQIVYPGMR